MKVEPATKLSETPIEIDLAARTFVQGAPMFKKLVSDLSMKSLKRLLIALIEFGLHDDKVQLLQTSEVPAFQLGMELLEAKAKMIEYSVKQNSEKEVENG